MYFGQSGESRRIDSKFGKVNHLAWSHLLKGTHPTTLLCMCECGVFFCLWRRRRRWSLGRRGGLFATACPARCVETSQRGRLFQSTHVQRFLTPNTADTLAYALLMSVDQFA